MCSPRLLMDPAMLEQEQLAHDEWCTKNGLLSERMKGELHMATLQNNSIRRSYKGRQQKATTS